MLHPNRSTQFRVLARASDGRLRIRWRRFLSILAFLGLTLFISAEVFFRYAYYEKLKTRIFPNIYEPHSFLGYRYIPGARSRIRMPGIDRDVLINDNGHVGPSFSKIKPAGFQRIAIVDTSNGTGIWMAEGDCYAAKLQKKIDEKGLNIEILNFSIDGRHRSLAQLRQIEFEVLSYEPDLILTNLSIPVSGQVFFRDVHRGYVFDYGHSLLSNEEIEASRREAIQYIDDLEGSLLCTLYDWSYVFRAYCRWLILRGGPSAFVEKLETYSARRRYITMELQTHTVESSIRRILETLAIVRRSGAELMLISYEGPSLAPDAYQEAGIPRLNIALPPMDRYVSDYEGHIDDAGQEVIAEAFYRSLFERE